MNGSAVEQSVAPGSFRQTTSVTFLSEEGLGGDSAPSEKAVSLDESKGSADERS